jgi:hypothetical protein
VTDVRRRLEEWREAGLVSAEQAAAIVAYEDRRGPADAVDETPSDAADDRRPGRPRRRSDRQTVAAEAVGYVGAALAVGALVLLLQELWRDLLVGGRLALVGVLTVLLLAGGMALRRTDRAPLQRLASVLFTGALIGVGWLTVLITSDLLRWRDLDIVLAVGVTTTAVALPLYLMRRRAMPQLTLLVTVGILIGALLARPALEVDALWVGLVFWTFGVSWALLGLGRWLEPPRVAGVLGGIVALLATQVTSFEDSRTALLTLGVLTAAALVALAVAADGVHHLAVGAVGLFVLVPQLAFELFGDAIGAPATLLVVGLLLVLLAVGLGRARREVASDARGGEHR